MKMTVAIALLAAALAVAHAQDVSVQVYVNGQLRSYSPPARLRNGTVYVPLRHGAESLGAECKWHAETNTAQICSNSGCALIRKSEGIIVDGSLFLPLRRLGQALGAKVSWDAGKRAVMIQKG